MARGIVEPDAELVKFGGPDGKTPLFASKKEAELYELHTKGSVVAGEAFTLNDQKFVDLQHYIADLDATHTVQLDANTFKYHPEVVAIYKLVEDPFECELRCVEFD